MVSQLKQSINPDTKLETVFISHSDCEDAALKLAEMVRATVSVQNIEIVAMGPVIGAHVGPGAITLIFTGDMTREEYENNFYNNGKGK
jgi:fatty acid-binding protein DegV